MKRFAVNFDISGGSWAEVLDKADTAKAASDKVLLGQEPGMINDDLMALVVTVGDSGVKIERRYVDGRYVMEER